MRATVTLQKDVAQAIDRLCREQRSGVSVVVNGLIRRGLAQPRTRAPFRQRTSDMHARLDVTNVGAALDTIEGPAAR